MRMAHSKPPFYTFQHSIGFCKYHWHLSIYSTLSYIYKCITWCEQDPWWDNVPLYRLWTLPRVIHLASIHCVLCTSELKAHSTNSSIDGSVQHGLVAKFRKIEIKHLCELCLSKLKSHSAKFIHRWIGSCWLCCEFKKLKSNIMKLIEM